jgi:hypothetical protein
MSCLFGFIVKFMTNVQKRFYIKTNDNTIPMKKPIISALVNIEADFEPIV